MPLEQSLNDPLSGAEIKQICVQKFADALDRDCTLVDDVAYPGFHIKLEATIRFTRSRTQNTAVWADHKQGSVEDADENLAQVEYETDSPNRAREENDLPLPVMIQTPTGPKRQKVKFQKKYGKK